MNTLTKLFRTAVAASLFAACPGIVLAGNIRQYSFSKSTRNGYEALTDAVPIVPEKWSTQSVIYPGGVVKIDKYTGEGFPIGFDFRFGGQIFDQFIVSNTGAIVLGKGTVNFSGHADNYIFGKDTGYMSSFYAGMTPVMCGTRSGNISYKTEGSEGKRVLTVQFADMVVNETEIGVPLTRCGRFALQIRLYEETGNVQYAFQEIQTPNKNNGLYAMIRGWDNTDAMLLTSDGLNNKYQASPKRGGNLLERDTYIIWDADDPDNEYAPVITFSPCMDQTPVHAAPTDLQIVQEGKNVIVSCKRAEGAPATMILASDKPFTEAEVPTDGVTTGVKDADGNYTFSIGNANVLYYDDEETPRAVITDIPEKTSIYVRAFSVNGYPVYDPAEYSVEASLIAAQNPPANFVAETEGAVAHLSWTSKYPVIVAATREHTGSNVYCGVFGQPKGDVAVGDMIEGGGEVIYTGDASSFDYTMPEPNTLYLFRIWNVDSTSSTEGGLVSATGSDTEAVPAPTFPWVPDVENYPYNVNPLGWINENGSIGFYPAWRNGDHLTALRAWSIGKEPTSCATPAFPAAINAKLTFEFGIETMRDPEKDPETGIEMLKGYEPGWFGEVEGAGLTISMGETGQETELKRVTEYNGTMDRFAGDDWQEGSCTYEPVEVEIGEIPAGHRLGFSIKSEKTTAIFIRKIRLEAEINGVATTIATAGDLTVTAGRGEIILSAAAGCKADIYNALGARVASRSLSAGESVRIALPAGIYVAGGQKVVVR